MGRLSSHQQQEAMREAYSLFERVRCRLVQLRYRDPEADSEREGLEAELWDAECSLLDAGMEDKS